MKSVQEQIRFTTEFTKDGSPTLRLPDDGESMHHMGGAASETKYIYYAPMKAALGLINDLSLNSVQFEVGSVGLGLAYIEICWAQAIAELGLNENWQLGITSFEKEETLKNDFRDWLNNSLDKGTIYDHVCSSLSESANIREIKTILKDNFSRRPIRGNLLLATSTPTKFHVICYDAFSSKTNQELWTEVFLELFVQSFCQTDCVFTTYACTGTLKKVLLRNGFDVFKRPGFLGKRDCTLALRGRFSDFRSHFQTS